MLITVGSVAELLVRRTVVAGASPTASSPPAAAPVVVRGVSPVYVMISGNLFVVVAAIITRN